ncbi:hypothetical protein AVEN_13738-1 [Araneus ventricosus]|uniref:Histone-lysine N-methyltransferase SETMAR n=1 Tax=Araneus ventricosus TaxID=182803 RepID=A0A4Y2LID1_ARAVE|nr:hypothetical protein AVEN_13738-1 [Araneus ventricosus]
MLSPARTPIHTPSPLINVLLTNAEVWFVEKNQCSCFLSDFTRLRRIFRTFGFVLIHDNARRHSAVVTQQLLEQLKWDVSDHPAFNPDLATSDFHLFPELKNWEEMETGGRSFL